VLPTIHLLGIPIHSIDEETCIEYILDEGDRGHGGWVATPNLDHLRRLHRNAEFRELCTRASLLVPDGIPLLWAARLQGTPLEGRVAGSDLIDSLSKAAASRGKSVFLLGGDTGTAEGAARILSDRHQGLMIAGIRCPLVGFETRQAEMESLRHVLLETKPDIVFVALGSPKQEKIMDLLAPILPETWWIGVGISFSFVCGSVRRAPRWMQRSGLEWVHRMLQEPHRLAGRYLVRGVPFALQLFAISMWKGLFRRPA